MDVWTRRSNPLGLWSRFQLITN
uniref:Uncharacterized protein n=1 Tax=Rhizophora mucronata TaxID=61149 RepID=A0A2P2IU59_RHIMU